MIPHEELVNLVTRVNTTLAILSWPFVLYEVFAKNPAIADFQARLELKRDKLLGLVVLDMADRLRPYLPQRASKIIIEPEFKTEESSRLSDEAIEEMKECLESHAELIGVTLSLKGMATRVLRLDKWMYTLIFSIAFESVAALVYRFVSGQMTDRTALLLLAVPLSTALLALLAAGLRQRLIYIAQTRLISEE